MNVRMFNYLVFAFSVTISTAQTLLNSPQLSIDLKDINGQHPKIAISPNSDYLGIYHRSVTIPSSITVWDLETRGKVFTYIPEGYVWRLEFQSHRQVLAFQEDDKIQFLNFDPDFAGIEKTIDPGLGIACCTSSFDLSPDGNLVATAHQIEGEQYDLRIFDAATGSLVELFEPDRGVIDFVKFSDDLSKLYMSSPSSCSFSVTGNRIFDTLDLNSRQRTNRMELECDINSEQYPPLFLSSGSNRLFSTEDDLGSFQGFVRDLHNGEIVQGFAFGIPSRFDKFNGAAPLGGQFDFFVSIHGDKAAIWAAHDSNPIGIIDRPDSTAEIRGLNVSDDGKYVVLFERIRNSPYDDGRVSVWDVSDITGTLSEEDPQTAAVDLSMASGNGISLGAEGVYGWQFRPAVPIQVTHLGWFDAFSPGFDAPHDVGIFEVSTATLLASTSIGSSSVPGETWDPSGSFSGQFRYELIAPLTLSPSESYIIAGFNHLGGADVFAAPIFDGVVYDSRVTFEGFWGDANLTALGMPTQFGPGIPGQGGASNEGRYGANFQFNVISPDTDSDGIPDNVDNCPCHANTDQLDANSNNVGDACESILYTITVDPGGYAATYSVSSSPFVSGINSFQLSLGIHGISINGVGSFQFEVDSCGQVTSLKPTSAEGNGNSLVFKNTPITIDPDAFAGPYSIRDHDQVVGLGNFVVIPEFSYDLLVPGEPTDSFFVSGECVINPDQFVVGGSTFQLFCDLNLNEPPSINVDQTSVAANEGALATNTGSWMDPNGDAVLIDASIGTVVQAGTMWTWQHATVDGPSESQSVTVTIDDGQEIASVTFDLVVNNIAPSVTILGPPTGLLEIVETGVLFEAEFSDPGLSDSHTAEWTFTNASAMEAVSGTVFGNMVSDSIEFLEAGVYLVTLTMTDSDGESGVASTINNDPESPAMVVIYDPDGGFVTGGGWIYSLPGSLHEDLDPLAEGKATFGFVSKYKKGANSPTGKTEFQFQAGGLNFKSDAYQWLVVAGARAQFKGTGSVNGDPGFGFMLTAIDSAINGGGDYDRFRIKIWIETDDETIIYDNQRGADDNGELSDGAALGGGNVVIHK